MFSWFDIEKNAREWDILLDEGYEYLFNSSVYLMLHKKGNSQVIGILSENKNIKIGGLLHNNRCFECLMFPDTATPDFVNNLFQWLIKNNIKSVIINSFSSALKEHSLKNYQYSVTERIEFVADAHYCGNLSKKILHKTHRRTINKFERSEVELVKVKKSYFICLVFAYFDKIKRKPYLYNGMKSLIKEILNIFKLSKLLKSYDEFSLYSIKDNKNNLAFALILESGSAAYYMIGASRKRGYKMRASVYLMWTLLNKYCDEGIEFNMGGVNKSNNTDEGVYKFKKQFGLDEQERKSFQVDL